jgi:hypothetical protein
MTKRWMRRDALAWAFMAAALAPLPLATAQTTAHTTAETPPPQPPRPAYVWPATLSNAKVMAPDSGADRLRATMFAFTAALGVRCSFCHVGGDEIPLGERDFASDANPRKDIARAMMRMTWQLNRETLPAISGLKEPRLSCFSCHGGRAKPLLAAEPAPPAKGS